MLTEGISLQYRKEDLKGPSTINECTHVQTVFRTLKPHTALVCVRKNILTIYL